MSGDVKMELCPFCGCDPVFAYSSGSVSGVRCPQCDARTGYCDQQQAIAAWNRRSSSAAERAVVEEKAALFDYLVEYCSYSYGGDSYSEPSPPEFGIQWAWRATTTARPSMLDQLRRDAFAKFDLYVNEMDPDDEPTEFGRLIISHRDALSSVRGEGGDKQATRREDAATAPISTDTKGTTK